MKKRFFSIQFKILTGIAITGFVIGLLSIISIRMIAANIIDNDYCQKAEKLAQTAAAVLDAEKVNALKKEIMAIYDTVEEPVLSSSWGSDEWNAYMALFSGIEESPVFTKLREDIRVLQDINQVDCIYITVFDENGALYLVDGAYEDACPPGCVDYFAEIGFDYDAVMKDDPGLLDAYFTNEEIYGSLVTAGAPIYYNGKAIAFVCNDISMNEVRAEERAYVIYMTVMITVITLLIIAIGLWYVNRNLIHPVIALSDTAQNYCSEGSGVYHHNFEKLSFATHDEIAELLSSMQQMEADMNANIETLVNTKNELRETTEKTEEMTEVAMKDPLTSVGSKNAYEKLVKTIETDIEGGAASFGIVMIDLNDLKLTNDTYGHENGNIAIKTICKMVCDVFAHSPVFRIGGDEFVVIVKNRDYENVLPLIASLKKRMEDNQKNAAEPYEKVSAAIGFSSYDKSIDPDYKTVFTRADTDMYENKRRMKGM
ncbi:MAG: diguanylate cyclase [Lachnospiraceae bacterium]|nr:diguanylate cyclase [Lachnospiraceae bacterium]